MDINPVDSNKRKKKIKKPDFNPPLVWVSDPAGPHDFTFEEDTGLKSEALLEVSDLDPLSLSLIYYSQEQGTPYGVKFYELYDSKDIVLRISVNHDGVDEQGQMMRLSSILCRIISIKNIYCTQIIIKIRFLLYAS